VAGSDFDLDSYWNICTGEIDTGWRVQRLVLVPSPAQQHAKV
jgi:hypothetical protein